MPSGDGGTIDAAPGGDATIETSADSGSVDGSSNVAVDTCPPLPADPVKAMYQAVDPMRLITHLKIGSGEMPVNLGGDAGTVTITNRWSPQAKAWYRAFFEQQLSSYG